MYKWMEKNHKSDLFILFNQTHFFQRLLQARQVAPVVSKGKLWGSLKQDSFYRPDALPVANQQCQSTEEIEIFMSK